MKLLIIKFPKMKKYILGGIALLMIAAIAAWNVSLNLQRNDLSRLSLANVEALAYELPPVSISCGQTTGQCWITSMSCFLRPGYKCMFTGYSTDFCVGDCYH
jgi:hypothetical protein